MVIIWTLKNEFERFLFKLQHLETNYIYVSKKKTEMYKRN